MISFQINEAELDSLRGRSWIAQLIYLRALRPYMDFATGVVGGPSRRISYQSLAEEMHRDPRQGRHSADSGYPSIKELRSGLLELERDLSEPEHPRPPLLRRINADRQLVFQLPLAATDSSASKVRGRRGADVGQTNSGRPNASSGGVSASMNGRRGADPEDAMMGTHPVSGNPEKNSDTAYRSQSDRAADRPESSTITDPAAEAKRQAWRIGAALLTPHCRSEQQARSLIGKLVRQHGDTTVIAAINHTAHHQPAQPVEYLTAYLQQRHGSRGYNAAAETYREAFGHSASEEPHEQQRKPVELAR